MKRYRWEIRNDSEDRSILRAHPLNHKYDGAPAIFLTTLQRDNGIAPLRRPYRVSYTIPDLCRARWNPKAHGRRAYRCKAKCE